MTKPLENGAVIVVIGSGPTGTAVARTLLPRLGPGARYVVVDRDPFGEHLAFGTAEPNHLTNTRATMMSLDVGDTGEFGRWLTARSADDLPGFSLEFPQRALFGNYAREVFDEAVAAARRAGVLVEVVRDEVVEIRRGRDEGWQVVSGSGAMIDADRVVLCTGMVPPSDPFPVLLGHPWYVSDPWRIPDLPAAASVAVLGSRLTAIDAAMTLRTRGHLGPITLASRTGWLPRIRGPETTAPVAAIEGCLGAAYQTGTLRLADFGRAIIADIEAASSDIPDWSSLRERGVTTRAMLADELAELAAGRDRGWQSVINSGAQLLLPAWQLLEKSGRAEFFAEWLTLLLVHAAPIPPATAERIVAAMDAGQLGVIGGVRKVETDGDRFVLETDDETYVADVVVNATGPGADIGSLRTEPLIRSLLDGGTASHHRMGGLRADPSTFELLDSSGNPSRGIHAVGDLIRAEVLVTNDVNSLVFQAALLTNVLSPSRS